MRRLYILIYTGIYTPNPLNLNFQSVIEYEFQRKRLHSKKAIHLVGQRNYLPYREFNTQILRPIRLPIITEKKFKGHFTSKNCKRLLKKYLESRRLYGR